MKNLVWYDSLQFFALLLMAAAMPVSFHCGLWAGAALGATSIVKMIAQRRIGNRSLSKPLVIAFAAIILYWLIYVVSLVQGGDIHEGLQAIVRKAVLLIFASCFLLTDTSYLKEKQFRWLFYALWLSVCGVFLYYVGVGVGKLFGGSTLEEVCGEGFDPRHHAYTALYVDTALAFVYVELQSQWRKLQRGLRTALIASVPLLILYVLIVNSRAGVVVMWMVAAIGVLHLLFFKGQWKQALLVALLFTGYTLGISHVLPGHTDRIADTIEKVTESAKDEEKETDARIDINKSALELAMGRFWTGYGVGNYRGLLVEQYEDDEYEPGVDNAFNAHNQYTETVLAIGIFGLLVLMAFLLIPLWRAWLGRRYLLPALLLTAIVCVNLLFESMLERQMGLLFIGYFMSLMILLVNLRDRA